MPHSQAKLDFYSEYLKRYLQVLLRAPHVKRINLYDAFCGKGKYDDGKFGSPILTFKIVKDVYYQLKAKGVPVKPLSMFVNDGKKEFVENVRDIIDSQNVGNYCTISYNALPADEAFLKIRSEIDAQKQGNLNLVFIDPYSWSPINKETIVSLLKNRKCEIILWLPLAMMNRFFVRAVLDETEDQSIAQLKRFLFEFIPESKHFEASLSKDNLAKVLAKEFEFGTEFFSSYYLIQRDQSNFYAIFFITPHIYGLEKILEVKWELDEKAGKAFIPSQSSGQISMFGESVVSGFNNALEQFIFSNGNVNNVSLYEFTLRNDHLAKHTRIQLQIWQESGKVIATTINDNKAIKAGRYLLNYKEYKSGAPKVNFRLQEKNSYYGLPIIDRMDRSHLESGDRL